MNTATRYGVAVLLISLAGCASSPQRLAEDGYDLRIAQALDMALELESPAEALLAVDRFGIEQVHPQQLKALSKKLSADSWEQLLVQTQLLARMTTTEDKGMWPLNRALFATSAVALELYRSIDGDAGDFESSERAAALGRAIAVREDEWALLAADLFHNCQQSDRRDCISGYPITLDKLESNEAFVAALEGFKKKEQAAERAATLLAEAPAADVIAAMAADPALRHRVARFYLIGDGRFAFEDVQDGQATYLPYKRGTRRSADKERPYAVFIFVGPASVKRELLERRTTRSQFRAGTRSVPNPQYAYLQQQLQTANANAQAGAYAPAGVAGAFARGVAMGSQYRAQSILNELQRTPMYVEEEVLQDYDVEHLKVRFTAARNAEMVIVDERDGSAFSGRTIVENQVIEEFPQGLHEADVRTVYQGTIDDLADSLRSSTPTLSLSELIAAVSSTRATRSADGLLANAERRAAETVALKETFAVDDRGSRYSSSGSAHSIPGAASVVVIRDGMRTVGAGVFIARNLIVTNAHVVDGLSMTIVEDADGVTGSARLMKVNHAQDLALLKVDIDGEPVLFARRDDLKVGSDVYAVGHPSGLKFTVSKGSISAVRELRDEIGSPYAVVQTDASINPGNSGGPLLIGGRLAGINTFKLTQAEGLGFAVHVDEVQDFIR